MFLEIDTTSSHPIYLQLAQRIKFAIASGVFRPSELIPSVREMAKELTLNPNTVSSAFRELQNEGLVTSRRGMGLAVTETAPDQCRTDRLEFFRSQFAALYEKARQSGLTATEIASLHPPTARQTPKPPTNAGGSPPLPTFL